MGSIELTGSITDPKKMGGRVVMTRYFFIVLQG
jgi:hypothetical protein